MVQRFQVQAYHSTLLSEMLLITLFLEETGNQLAIIPARIYLAMDNSVFHRFKVTNVLNLL